MLSGRTASVEGQFDDVDIALPLCTWEWVDECAARLRWSSGTRGAPLDLDGQRELAIAACRRIADVVVPEGVHRLPAAVDVSSRTRQPSGANLITARLLRIGPTLALVTADVLVDDSPQQTKVLVTFQRRLASCR